MTINRFYTKGVAAYRLMGDDGGWIASFSSLVMAAAALRYLSGCELNDREKALALAALESASSEEQGTKKRAAAQGDEA